jgi:hypothetical protein
MGLGPLGPALPGAVSVDLAELLKRPGLDFGPAVASADGLPPGGQTNPVVVRLRLSHPDFAPSMRWKATGQVSGGPETSE